MPSRFGRILVPLDGSPLAAMALPAAGALARHAGATVHLASALPGRGRYSHIPPEIAATIEHDSRERISAYLASEATSLSMCRGLQAEYAVLDGSPAEALAEYAQRNSIDLIVMTTHGRSGLGRFWLGSVADRVIRNTQAPVLLLRSREQPQHTDFRHLLIALDGSKEGEAVLDVALSLARLSPEARCSLVTVAEAPLIVAGDFVVYPDQIYGQVLDEQQAAAKTRLEELAEQPRALGMTTTVHAPIASSAGAHIVELAYSLDADLIAVGTHHRGGVQRLLLGSVADKVIRGAATPILIVPL